MSRATASAALAAALAVAVVAVVAGGSSDDSGTGSSVTTSKRSDGGGETTAARAPSLQSAFDSAKYYLDNEEGGSKHALLQRVALGVPERYSKAEATYAVNHVRVDWNARAVEGAKGRLESQGLSKRSLMWYLTAADGYSKSEATYAVSRVAPDWNAEAVEAAKEVLDSGPIRSLT